MKPWSAGVFVLFGLAACNEVAGIDVPILDEECVPTNGGAEKCDGVDNDCDGETDELSDIDFNSPESCGICGNDCFETLLNNDPTTITCVPSNAPGKTAGQCKGTCAQNYHDVDGDGRCELYCVQTAADDVSCDGRDDDCDGKADEDVDFCVSTEHCGQCGRACGAANGTAVCVHSGPDACSVQNTKCEILSCKAGFWDADGQYGNGCEYPCVATNGGVEICDGIDNDCDALTDDEDDLSADAQIGVDCVGDPDGLCSTSHGMAACMNGTVVCAGALVLFEGQVPETCNGVDDDCDGIVDDAPASVGQPCGASNILPCSFGVYQCIDGVLACIGEIAPTPEVCDGKDNDCDGLIDSSGGNSPSDAMGACDVPIPPPAGVATACAQGTKACIGGTIACVGSKKAQSDTDTCGVDANCDGALTGQPDLQSDVNHCGACENDCMADAVHANWSCNSGVCKFEGCQLGYFDLDGDKKCEYACTLVQANEACNGVDDDCDGQIDENIIVPSPSQICGTGVFATAPECTTMVSVACVAGAWKCTFPSGVCSPSCAGATEICDSLDNDCDGLKNENVADWNAPCNSDDGLPPPGHGACRTSGVVACTGASSAQCNAVKADCNNLPGGCTELCDGVDNDCDGSTDESYGNKGNNPAYFVKPAVTKVGATNLWIYSYEASRPSATAVLPGTGNGYWTSAPTGSTLDRSPACSVPNKIPWFNVTPREAEQTCAAMGGSICTTTEWQAAARLPAPDGCLFGYAPLSAACSSSFVPGVKYCNLGPSYDFDPAVVGDQDGLLVTASSLLKSCFADWQASAVYDITGNLREITKSASNQYPLMGGAFDTQTESGASSSFTFYSVGDSFLLYDTGFRCCFHYDPTL